MDLNYAMLKARQREEREKYSPSLALRTHRALSWLQRAEQETGDYDVRFIFLWIAFNAAYANDLNDRHRFSEKRLLLGFLDRLIKGDKDNLLYHTVWDQFPQSIRSLLNNKYIYQPFWECHSSRESDNDWAARFEHDTKVVHRALREMNTEKILAVLFERLYVLRNQLVHGGATWNSSVNRTQMRDGANIMGSLVPIIIHLMMENSGELWGDPSYPVVAL